MTESEEQAYLDGERAALTRIVRECLRELGHEDKTIAKLVAEREATVAQLRRLCEEFGDNDWDAELHLADVVEKHLGRYLWDKSQEIEP